MDAIAAVFPAVPAGLRSGGSFEVLGDSDFAVFPAVPAGLRSGIITVIIIVANVLVFPAVPAGLRSGGYALTRCARVTTSSSRPSRPGSVAASWPEHSVCTQRSLPGRPGRAP